MPESWLPALLVTVRKLRGGTIDLVDVDDSLRAPLGTNLAGVCRTLAHWADTSVDDRRAADAFVRFRGLGQLPERRDAIAATLRTVDARRGLAVDTVDDLIQGVEAQLATEIHRLDFPRRWGVPTPERWCDPFPPDARCDRQRREAALLLAWADVPAGHAGLHQAERALLLYEAEHGLRAPLVAATHRQERARLRRLAWSMLWTALQRLAVREPGDVTVERLFGPRRLATVDRLPEGVADVFAGHLAQHDDDAADLIRNAVGAAEAAVRVGDPVAPELIGLLRDAVARRPPSAVGTDLIASMLALNTIVARESETIDGLQSGFEAVALGLEAGEAVRAHRAPRSPEWPERVSHLFSVSLRAAQELAELADLLGYNRMARRTLGRMNALSEFKEPSDRLIWQQQQRQTAASLLRHAAAESPRPRRWLDAADRAAEESYQMATSIDVPRGTVVAAANQRSAVALARLRMQGSHIGPRRRARLAQFAHDRTADAIRLATTIDDADRPHLSARLGAYRRGWELALLLGDENDVAAAQAATLALVGEWTPPAQLSKLRRLDERGTGRRTGPS
ncbi:hypothetical protein [Desertimonas flava]|uniref:hypothetical protein n=1 Tax=Desertimonas flava TaxID=2064846 RepID=UPI000E355BAF|nr:hypothetical protein [Desertimonas flava]